MICYASRTGTRKNIHVIAQAGWRMMCEPSERRVPPAGLRYAIDNGAWRCFKKKIPFEWEKFSELVREHGQHADFIVIPDVVANAEASMELSRTWLDMLLHVYGVSHLLFAVQDGMHIRDVGSILERYPTVGIFLGGSTEWKEREMYAWGCIAQAFRRYYHVARVNTARRMRLAMEAGAHSIDGSSVSRFACTLPLLDTAARQHSLLTPEKLQ